MDLSYLLERQRDRKRQRDFPFSGSLSKCQKQLGLGQGKSCSWEPSQALLCEWQGPKYLRHYLLPPGVCISRSWTQTQALR